MPLDECEREDGIKLILGLFIEAKSADGRTGDELFELAGPEVAVDLDFSKTWLRL